MDGHLSTPAPPPPLPKRRNAVLRLYDAPLYRDWAFWATVAWAAIAIASIASSHDSTSGLPVWLNTLLATVVIVLLFGVLPTWLRLLVRRWRWNGQAAREAVVTRVSATPTEAVSLVAPETATAPIRPVTAHRPDLLSDVFGAARETYPYPVARAVRALQSANTAKERYEAVLDAAEALAICLSVTAASFLLCYEADSAHGARRLSALRSTLLGKGAMFGAWTVWLNGLATPAGAEQFPTLPPGLLSALPDTPDRAGLVSCLNAMREERNRAAHGDRPLSEPASALRAAQQARHLELALAEANFLTGLPWLLTVSCVYRPRSNDFDITAQRVVGDHPEFEPVAFRHQRPVGNDMMYIQSVDSLIPLSPFVAHPFCEQCEKPELSYAQRARSSDGPGTYKSFGRGHSITSPDLGDELRGLPNARGERGQPVQQQAPDLGDW